MDACCETKAEELTALRGEHKKVLTVVLVINAVLFIVEAAAGLLAHSTALLADSLNMFGDSLVYGFSLYVLWRSAEWKARAAVFKGVAMALFGAGVLVGWPQNHNRCRAGCRNHGNHRLRCFARQWILLFSASPPPFRRSRQAFDLALLAQ